MLKHDNKVCSTKKEEPNFPNPSFFSKYFKRLVECTPCEYRGWIKSLTHETVIIPCLTSAISPPFLLPSTARKHYWPVSALSANPLSWAAPPFIAPVYNIPILRCRHRYILSISKYIFSRWKVNTGTLHVDIRQLMQLPLLAYNY